MPVKKNNSLIKSLMILESFTPGSLHLSLANIYRITKIPKPTTFRILKTLTDLNYLKYDATQKEYCLGPKVLSLGYSTLQTIDSKEIIRPYLESLSKECNRTVNFCVLDDTEMVYIERIKAPDIVFLDIVIGSRIPLFSTAVGKVALAHMEEEKLEDILEKIKSDPKAVPFIRNRNRLYRMLEEVKLNGYALNDEEYRKGIRAIAVPVLNSDGIFGGINLVVASALESMDELRTKYASPLLITSSKISEALGYSALHERK